MTRRYDPRRAKRHRSYSRLELCELYSVGPTAIWAWMRKGLRSVDDHRPYVFAGADVRDFIQRHNKPFHPTGPGEVYCVACKRVIVPAGDEVEFVPLSATNGNLIGSCPHCSRQVWQRVRLADVSRKAGHLKVRYEDGAATLLESAEPARSEPSSEVSA